MGDLNVENKPLPTPDELYNRGKSEIKDVRSFSMGDGVFKIINGRMEIRDSNGNIVILIDPNG